MKTHFKGWYFKHQGMTDTVAFIPGFCNDHAFIQVITNHGSCQYRFPSIQIRNHAIFIGKCIFSRKGLEIHLPDLDGRISYGSIQPLASDIMGPFRFVPMECRHQVLSMCHSISGRLVSSNQTYCFDGGKGYIEGDSGTSFPSSYLWLQCNDFAVPCSIMLSIAAIPFYGFHFTGCICAITYCGNEYRLATYNGVRILAATANHICLAQRNLLLEIDVHSNGTSYPLRSPSLGQMVNTIYEGCEAWVHIRLWINNKLVINVESERASFEIVK